MSPTEFPATGHDHHACVDDALREAEAHCRRHGLRLTELRRRVLELVWASHRPVGAYTVLERLAEEGRKGAPPTVYRSLEFLLEHHLIHRIASLNAYVGCNHPGGAHDAHFFICRGCGEAAELADPVIDGAIDEAAARLGFRAEQRTLEVSGLCARCAGEAPA
ncbi:Fur family transcriptional regulator [Endothiovibrio diazotrophicus]